MRRVQDKIKIICKGDTYVNIHEILSKVDHTLLAPTSTWCEMKSLCDEGIQYNVASVCIPTCYVKDARSYVKNALKLCAVIGFPNGYNTSEVKVFETYNALNCGANEIDMVINIGMLKDKRYSEIESEIKEIKKVCGKNVLKVIIETCLLTEDEKIEMCRIITDAGADFIKTSTGFSKAGANLEDMILFKNHIGKDVKIKAAGGISTLEDAEAFINAGASRLGTSKIVKLAKDMQF